MQHTRSSRVILFIQEILSMFLHSQQLRRKNTVFSLTCYIFRNSGALCKRRCTMSYDNYWSRQQRDMSDFYQRQRYDRIQQENRRRMDEMQREADRRRYEETQREMQRHNEETRRRFEAEQRVTNLILQQSHDTTSYNSSSSYYVSSSTLRQREANIKSAPAMCKPYEDRLLALIEQKYIELRAEHDKFRAEFLAKNPGQEMKCKPLMDRETSFLGITIKPSDRDKWCSIIGGEYLRSLKNTDDGSKIGPGYSGHVDVYSSVDKKTEYRVFHKCASKYCEACTGLAYRTKLSKYCVRSLLSPLYENGKNKRAPLSNEVNPRLPNFTIIDGQMVRTQPMFQPLPPYLRSSLAFEANKGWILDYDSIDGRWASDKIKTIYRD